ncbi:MAG: hypothetical protein KGL26_11130 [Pseudomonadota bacterium]|nr:hypothetical protein [Pseudomonadota bacterium]
MQALLGRWAEAFALRRPAIRIRVDRQTRLSSEGFLKLLDGRADCALFARELFPAERTAFIARYSMEPIVVPVAEGSFASLHATHALAFYVNAANPLRALTVGQLTALLRGPLPDEPPAIMRWGQLGARGVWAQRAIHLYGMTPYRNSGDPPGIVNFLRQRLLGGEPLRNDVRIIADRPGTPALAGIVAQVARDPLGIGYSGFGFARAGVRALQLCDAGGCRSGTPQSVAQGRYFLRRRIYLVIRPGHDGLAPSYARRFVRFVLSMPGQSLVGHGAEHFLPLPPAERRAALAQLRHAKTPVPSPYGVARMPAYRPAVVYPGTSVHYLDSTGAVRIVGYNDMRPMLAALTLLFQSWHPQLRFDLDLRGTRTAPKALASGRSLLAPMGADFEPQALAAYRRAVGASPMRFAVAHDAVDARARSSPLAVYVHRGNSLRSLTVRQVALVFSGVVARWGDLGATGPLARQPIHRYGLAPDTPLARVFATRILGHAALAPLATARHSRVVLARMPLDPLAIGFGDLNQSRAELRALALRRGPHGRLARGTPEDLITGRYPLDRHLLIFARRPIDALAREFLRLVLSRQGQQAIALARPHYLPLNVQELAAERAGLH